MISKPPLPVLVLLFFLVQSHGFTQENPLVTSKSGPDDLASVRLLVREGKTHEAEEEIRDYLKRGIDGGEIRNLLGLILYQEGRPGESLAEFTRGARFKTPEPSELIVVALDYVLLRDLANADKWLSVAVQRQPEDVAAWRYLGGIKYSENRFAEAIDSYGKCLKMHPHDVLVEDGIGRSLEGLARDEDAAAAYRIAMEWQADARVKHLEPMLHLGSLLVRKGQLREALPLLQSAEALAPADAEVHERLGNLWMQLGEPAKAQSQVEVALKLAPDNSHLHWLLASIYRKEGLTDQSNGELKKYSALLGAHSSDKLQ